MIPRLDEVDLVLFDQVDDAVLLRQTTGPRPSRKILQMLRLADSRERVPQSVFHHVEGAKRSLAISLNPVAQVLNELWMEDRAPGAFRLPWCCLPFTQGPTRGEALSQKKASSPPSAPEPGRSEVSQRSWETATDEPSRQDWPVPLLTPAPHLLHPGVG